MDTHELKGLGHENIEGRYFSHPSNIMQDTNGKSIYQRQNPCVSGMFKAIKDNRDGCDVRKYVLLTCHNHLFEGHFLFMA